MALRLTPDEKAALYDAATYHYLYDLDTYGVPEAELSESEADTRKHLLSAELKLRREVEGHYEKP